MRARKLHQLAVDLDSESRLQNTIELAALSGRCTVCRHADHSKIASVGPVPVLSCQLFSDPDSAKKAPTGMMEIVSCRRCGNQYNKDFEPERIFYDEDYENSLEYSSIHRAYLEDLATTLVAQFELKNGTVIDIGVGSGFLLKSMAERFGVTGLGIDPGVSSATERYPSGGVVRLLNGFFATLPAPIDSDLVCCMHVLEHLQAPWALLKQIRDRHLPRAARIYVEVPNGELLRSPAGVWDLIYEHVSHFTTESLHQLVESEGFHVLSSGKAFGEQYLWLIGESTGTAAPPSPKRSRAITPLGQHERNIEDCRKLVRQWAEADRRVGIWGAGAKGSTFANLVDPAGSLLSVFDVNPNKWNRFLPSSGHRISAPQELAALRPDIVITMNSLYTREIAHAACAIVPGVRVVDIRTIERAARMVGRK